MKYFTRIGDREWQFEFSRRGDRIEVRTDDAETTQTLDLSMIGDGTAFSMLLDGRSHDVIIEPVDGQIVVQHRGVRTAVEVLDERERAAKDVAGARPAGPQEVCAVMPGVVVELKVAEGDRVETGQTLAVLEAMKMQNPLQAEAPGVVKRVVVEAGQAVAGGALLMELENE